MDKSYMNEIHILRYSYVQFYFPKVYPKKSDFYIGQKLIWRKDKNFWMNVEENNNGGADVFDYFLTRYFLVHNNILF